MSKLEEYIEKLKKEIKPEWDNIRIARYVYIDLGRKMSFDTNYSFGNKEQKKKIYKDINPSPNSLNRKFETGIIICNSLSEIYKYILKQLGIDSYTITEENDGHVYNCVKISEDDRIIVDLQQDLQNIRAHCSTRSFGTKQENKSTIISTEKLKEIDEDIGYVSKDFYYADNYFYMLELATKGEISLQEKMDIILQNLDVYYNNRQTKYAERKWYHEELIKRLLSEKEQRKVQMIDAYVSKDNARQYTNIVSVELPKQQYKQYIFSEEKYKYIETSMEELISSGIIMIQKLPGLKKYLREKANETENENNI